MQRDTMIQWLSDLAEEARQYAQVYHTWLEAGRGGEPSQTAAPGAEYDGQTGPAGDIQKNGRIEL